jgi:hypothetical protein
MFLFGLSNAAAAGAFTSFVFQVDSLFQPSSTRYTDVAKLR